jgi:hypothetical protein
LEIDEALTAKLLTGKTLMRPPEALEKLLFIISWKFLLGTPCHAWCPIYFFSHSFAQQIARHVADRNA